MRGERNYYRSKRQKLRHARIKAIEANRMNRREEERKREAEREGPPIKPSCSLQS